MEQKIFNEGEVHMKKCYMLCILLYTFKLVILKTCYFIFNFDLKIFRLKIKSHFFKIESPS